MSKAVRLADLLMLGSTVGTLYPALWALLATGLARLFLPCDVARGGLDPLVGGTVKLAFLM